MNQTDNETEDFQPERCPFCGGYPEPIVDAREVLGVWRLFHRCKILGYIAIETSRSPQYLITQWNTRA